MNVTNVNDQVRFFCCGTCRDLGKRPLLRIVTRLKCIFRSLHAAPGVGNDDDAFDLGFRGGYIAPGDACAQSARRPGCLTSQHVKNSLFVVCLCAIRARRNNPLHSAHSHGYSGFSIPLNARASRRTGDCPHHGELTFSLHGKKNRVRLGRCCPCCRA